MFGKLAQQPRIVVIHEDIVCGRQGKSTSRHTTNTGSLMMQVEEAFVRMLSTVRNVHDLTERPILLPQRLLEIVDLGAVVDSIRIGFVVTEIVLVHRL